MFGGALPGPRGLLDYAKAAHSLGFRSAWAADHILHEAPSHYAPACLQAVATAVPEMKIGFAAMPAFLRHPLATAKVIFTLQILSGGRLEVALSIGDERPEMWALGVNPAERGRRLDETLEVLTRLATEDEVTYRDKHYSFEGARLRPKPPEGRLPPLFIASWSGTKSLQRILRFGCGWMASGLFSLEKDLRQGMAALRGSAQEQGKPQPATILTNVLTLISEDPGRLERAGALFRSDTGPRVDTRGMRLVGPRELVRERLAQIEALGFQRLNVLPLDFDVAQLEAFMRLVR